jgi:phospholipid transport system substrate-binding protein
MRCAIIGMMTAVLAGAVPVAASAEAATGAAATSAETESAGQFISNLADKVFAVLKENQSKGATKAKFRSLLKDNFAVDTAGAKLIRRYRNQITPVQLAAYQSALPDYVVNVYADRLIAYGDATVKVVRTQAHGPTGNVDVFSHIIVPGKKELDIIWLVEKSSGGKWLIDNVTVSGVNMSLTQEADFSAFIAKNGFDALVAMMKSSNARTA